VLSDETTTSSNGCHTSPLTPCQHDCADDLAPSLHQSSPISPPGLFSDVLLLTPCDRAQQALASGGTNSSSSSSSNNNNNNNNNTLAGEHSTNPQSSDPTLSSVVRPSPLPSIPVPPSPLAIGGSGGSGGGGGGDSGGDSGGHHYYCHLPVSYTCRGSSSAMRKRPSVPFSPSSSAQCGLSNDILHSLLRADSSPESDANGSNSPVTAVNSPLHHHHHAAATYQHYPIQYPEEFFDPLWGEDASLLPNYADAFLACPAARLQKLPKGHKNGIARDWQMAARAIAVDALTGLEHRDEARFAAGVRLFLELPARTLAIDAIPSQPLPRTVAQRAIYQRSALQDLVLKGIVRHIPTPPPGKLQTCAAMEQSQGPQELQSYKVRRTKQFLEDGLLSRALGTLTSQPIAKASVETLSKLVALHPPNPTPLDEWPPLPLPPLQRQQQPHSLPAKIAPAQVAAAIRHLPRGIAAGPSGWTYELIQAALGDEDAGPVCALLTEIVQRALQGRLCWRGAFTASRLVALQKPDGSSSGGGGGGIRPIAVGEAFYRLIGRVCLAVDPEIQLHHARAYVGCHQYGIARPGGVEIPIHAIRELCESDQLSAVLSLDWANAYNSQDRVTTAREVHARAPAYAPVYKWSYGAESALILPVAFGALGHRIILSQAGVRQGDALGPLFFSIGLAPIVETIASMRAIMPWAYIDDILAGLTKGLTREAIMAAAHHLMDTVEQEGAKQGLKLNRAKCILWIPGGSSSSGGSGGGGGANNRGQEEEDKEEEEEEEEEEDHHHHYHCPSPKEDGLKILGAPVGHADYMQHQLEAILQRESKAVTTICQAEGLSLQHKLLLLRCCTAQVPIFWARTVRAASGPMAQIWDPAIAAGIQELLGVDLTSPDFTIAAAAAPVGTEGNQTTSSINNNNNNNNDDDDDNHCGPSLLSLQKLILGLPVRLGGLGYTNMAKCAPRAFVASVLSAAAAMADEEEEEQKSISLHPLPYNDRNPVTSLEPSVVSTGVMVDSPSVPSLPTPSARNGQSMGAVMGPNGHRAAEKTGSHDRNPALRPATDLEPSVVNVNTMVDSPSVPSLPTPSARNGQSMGAVMGPNGHRAAEKTGSHDRNPALRPATDPEPSVVNVNTMVDSPSVPSLPTPSARNGQSMGAVMGPNGHRAAEKTGSHDRNPTLRPAATEPAGPAVGSSVVNVNTMVDSPSVPSLPTPSARNGQSMGAVMGPNGPLAAEKTASQGHRHSLLIPCSPATRESILALLQELEGCGACLDVEEWRDLLEQGIFPKPASAAESYHYHQQQEQQQQEQGCSDPGLWAKERQIQQRSSSRSSSSGGSGGGGSGHNQQQQQHHAKGLKLQRRLQGRAHNAVAASLALHMHPPLLTVFQDAATPGSGAWLNVVPTSRLTRLPDSALLTAARTKLLVPPSGALAASGLCAACGAHPAGASHAWNCKQLSMLRSARHDSVVQRLMLALRRMQPQCEVDLEAPSLHQEARDHDSSSNRARMVLRRADLWVPASGTAVDVIVTASSVQHPTMAAAIRAAEARKTSKYGPLVRAGVASKVVPFVVGPFGTLSKAAQGLLMEAVGVRPLHRQTDSSSNSSNSRDQQELEKATQQQVMRARAYKELIAVATVIGTAMMAKAWEHNQAYLMARPQQGSRVR